MKKYYKGQTIEITLIMEVDITGAGTVQIKYRKPSGATGFWTAAIIEAESGTIRYTLPGASNDEKGVWVIWAYVVQADAAIVIGTPCEMPVEDQGY